MGARFEIKSIDMMPKLLALIVLCFAIPTIWSGDEFKIPTLRNGTAYESVSPNYRMIGVEDQADKSILWVVADSRAVLTQNGVNRIIRDIRHRLIAATGSAQFSEIWFYSSVSNTPQYPAFRITDNLAVYNTKENKVRFGPGAKGHYGGWVYGPYP